MLITMNIHDHECSRAFVDHALRWVVKNLASKVIIGSRDRSSNDVNNNMHGLV